MSDTITSQPLPEVQDSTGQGRHRGPVSTHDSESAPHGRHRKPLEQRNESASF
ncbi:hypothetical protein ACWCPM_20845 [Streptomyces sp. NPDC002309]